MRCAITFSPGSTTSTALGKGFYFPFKDDLRHRYENLCVVSSIQNDGPLPNSDNGKLSDLPALLPNGPSARRSFFLELHNLLFDYNRRGVLKRLFSGSLGVCRSSLLKSVTSKNLVQNLGESSVSLDERSVLLRIVKDDFLLMNTLNLPRFARGREFVAEGFTGVQDGSPDPLLFRDGVLNVNDDSYLEFVSSLNSLQSGKVEGGLAECSTPLKGTLMSCLLASGNGVILDKDSVMAGLMDFRDKVLLNSSFIGREDDPVVVLRTIHYHRFVFYLVDTCLKLLASSPQISKERFEQVFSKLRGHISCILSFYEDSCGFGDGSWVLNLSFAELESLFTSIKNASHLKANVFDVPIHGIVSLSDYLSFSRGPLETLKGYVSSVEKLSKKNCKEFITYLNPLLQEGIVIEKSERKVLCEKVHSFLYMTFPFLSSISGVCAKRFERKKDGWDGENDVASKIRKNLSLPACKRSRYLHFLGIKREFLYKYRTGTFSLRDLCLQIRACLLRFCAIVLLVLASLAFVTWSVTKILSKFFVHNNKISKLGEIAQHFLIAFTAFFILDLVISPLTSALFTSVMMVIKLMDGFLLGNFLSTCCTALYRVAVFLCTSVRNFFSEVLLVLHEGTFLTSMGRFVKVDAAHFFKTAPKRLIDSVDGYFVEGSGSFVSYLPSTWSFNIFNPYGFFSSIYSIFSSSGSESLTVARLTYFCEVACDAQETSIEKRRLFLGNFLNIISVDISSIKFSVFQIKVFLGKSGNYRQSKWLSEFTNSSARRVTVYEISRALLRMHILSFSGSGNLGDVNATGLLNEVSFLQRYINSCIVKRNVELFSSSKQHWRISNSLCLLLDLLQDEDIRDCPVALSVLSKEFSPILKEARSLLCKFYISTHAPCPSILKKGVDPLMRNKDIYKFAKRVAEAHSLSLVGMLFKHIEGVLSTFVNFFSILFNVSFAKLSARFRLQRYYPPSLPTPVASQLDNNVNKLAPIVGEISGKMSDLNAFDSQVNVIRGYVTNISDVKKRASSDLERKAAKYESLFCAVNNPGAKIIHKGVLDVMEDVLLVTNVRGIATVLHSR